MKPFLLAILLLSLPAFAKTDQPMQLSNVKPHCMTTTVAAKNGTLAVRACPEMISYFRAVEIARQERLKKPCDMAGRVRSKADGRCYRPERLP